MIVHLNGMPGVGKFTVANLLAEKLNARLIDNHLVIDLVLAVCERGSPHYSSMIKRINDVILEQIAETPDKTFIFTNALATEISGDRERFEQFSQFTKNKNLPFVQIFLDCDLEENKKRIISENRKLKGKLLDPNEIETLRKNYTIYHPPTEYELAIETTHLSPEDVSEQIKVFVEKIKSQGK